MMYNVFQLMNVFNASRHLFFVEIVNTILKQHDYCMNLKKLRYLNFSKCE